MQHICIKEKHRYPHSSNNPERNEMNFFELYQTINENQEQKNNILATALEGTEAGNRYFFSEGELLGKTASGELDEEFKEQIAGTTQSGILETTQGKFFAEHLKRQAHLVI